MTEQVSAATYKCHRTAGFKRLTALLIPCLLIAGILIGPAVPSALAAGLAVDTISEPKLVASTGATAATMGIPRWKAYMSGEHDYKLWITVGGHSSAANNVYYTEDKGVTWSDETINPNINGYLDMHAALYGSDEGLFWTFPTSSGLGFRCLNYPAESNDDRDNIVYFEDTSTFHRASVMVDGTGRIWVFSRLGSDLTENVKYHYSDDNGSTWTTGQAFDADWEDVRIGSMPYIDGSPCLVVLFLQHDRGYEYFHWNGERFVQYQDSTIWAENMNRDRAFTHNVISDDTFHMVFGHDEDLLHLWKSFDGGRGEWNVVTVDSALEMEANDWDPISAAYGDYLFLFYTLVDATGNSHIYLRQWDQDTKQWSDRQLVSSENDDSNRYPNTCRALPAGADYVPVFWVSGPELEDVKYARINLVQDMSPVTTPVQQGFRVAAEPNPSNSVVRFAFSDLANETCKVEIFDIRGRLVFQSEATIHSGTGSLLWQGRNLDGEAVPSGQYFLRATAGREIRREKLTILR